MNAWPKLVSEEMVPSTITHHDIYALSALRRPHSAQPDFNLEPLLQEAWWAIAQERRVDILRSASRLQTALEDFFAALQMGSDAGLHRSFVDHFLTIDAPLRRFLWTLDSGKSTHATVYPKALPETQYVPGPDAHASKPPSNLAWNLSKKEILVLHLVRLGLSNKGVAREMQIAPETVKSHIKRIFIKLASKNRAEAVSRATELGLL